MNALKDRIKLAMAGPPKISQAALARACGISAPSVHDWVSGKTKSIEGENLLKAARFLDVEPLWLATGKGPIKRADGSGREPSNVAPALQPTREAREYPVISWVVAGERAHSPDNYAPGLAEEWLTSTEDAGPHGYWLIVKGPSMTAPTPPSFPDGTPILIKPEGFDLVSGKFYIGKHIEGETTFKQYIYDTGREYLVPLNNDFKQVEMDDKWDVIGRVIDMKAPRGVL